MSDWLVYYRDYWDDANAFPNEVATDHWYTAQRHWYERAERGDSLWIVVRDIPNHPDEWRLLEKLVISKLEIRRQYERPYYAGCVEEQHQFFDINKQPDFALVLMQLEFHSGKRIQVNGALIGRSIQTMRRLSTNDEGVLAGYAKTLRTASQQSIRSPR